ncbi:MAG: NADH-quinone oxidoreductase subunit J family protein [Candidatus Binatia bacterium]
MTVTPNEIVFFVVAALAVVSALTVILHPHPVYSALALIVTLFQISIFFLLLDAQMVAFLQILVYAGAIMVLFLFVIMLLNLQRETEAIAPSWRLTTLGVSGALAAEFVWFFVGHAAPLTAPAGELDEEYGSVRALGAKLFTDHALSFELTSVLLLIAVVGAVVLGRRGAN